MLIIGSIDRTIDFNIRVGYKNLQMTPELQKLLAISLKADPFLKLLQIDPKRPLSLLYIIKGQLDKPLEEPVRTALQLAQPARLTMHVLDRILKIKAQELKDLLAEALDEPVEVKYHSLL
ncbi:MAG: hypothetical protein NVSMB39_1730 [Candidatus Saccharimonadales bacterium]